MILRQILDQLEITLSARTAGVSPCGSVDIQAGRATGDGVHTQRMNLARTCCRFQLRPALSKPLVDCNKGCD